MGTNQFVTFAVGAGANVLSPTAYAALSQVSTGYQSGIAPSIQVNTSIRQPAFVAHCLCQAICDYLGANANDDGNVSELENSIAQFVSLVGGGGVVATVSANGSLTLLQAGIVKINASGGNIALNLPAAAAAGGAGIKYTFLREDSTTNIVTISRVGSDVVAGGTSLNLPPEGRLDLNGDGVSAWEPVQQLTVVFGEQQTSGTNCPTNAPGTNSYATRVINAALDDPWGLQTGGQAVFGANTISLQQGEWQLEAHAPCCQGLHKLVWYNSGSSSIVLAGTAENALPLSAVSNRVFTRSFVRGTFTVPSGGESFQIRHYENGATSTADSEGFGRATNDGTPEIYSVIALKRIG